MQFLDVTLPTLEENLALDEALLDAAEGGRGAGAVLRVWEWSAPAVVLGRASRAAQEVRLDRCRFHNVPVVRRCSGGAAVVIGPGCWMYTLILPISPDISRRPDRMHAAVLNPIAAALAACVPGVVRAGTSDLARDAAPAGDAESAPPGRPPVRDPAPRKFSGNSLRCRRGRLLYHGTMLYDFDVSLVGELLTMPPRRPDYRGERDHADFLCNLPLDRAALCRTMRTVWDAWEPLTELPLTELQALLPRYRDPAWHFEL
ncbi:MAG: lipoate--protein ligase family protein [Thermogutta sp.]|nr:lipoate--protein ligase family protein [Thermogutta sp.]